MKISIFTPTYNRARLLKRLYDSLSKQSFKDFEWVVVDDGSTDETEQLIESYINEGNVDIQYYKQPNGGKHRAINKGLDMCKGELFYIVDSDDYLPDSSLSIIVNHWENISEDDLFAGILGKKAYTDGRIVGGDCDYEVLDTTYSKFDHRGDMALIFKTSVFRKFKFPDFENEKFCDEALVWNRISGAYKIRFVSDILLIGDYLDDGLTAKMTQIRYDSPKATMLFHLEQSHDKSISLKKRIKALTGFWRYSKRSHLSFSEKWRDSGHFLLNILALPGFCLKRLKDRKRLNSGVSNTKKISKS